MRNSNVTAVHNLRHRGHMLCPTGNVGLCRAAVKPTVCCDCGARLCHRMTVTAVTRRVDIFTLAFPVLLASHPAGSLTMRLLASKTCVRRAPANRHRLSKLTVVDENIRLLCNSEIHFVHSFMHSKDRFPVIVH